MTVTAPVAPASLATTGAVVALPHSGNWDLAGAWACLTGMPVSTVAERLKPAEFAAFLHFREGLGMEVLAHDDRGALPRLANAVGEGRLSLEEVVRLRDGGHREIDFRVMPARGLTLVDVGYPEPGLLQSRAATTRQRRSHEHVAAGAD
jgi:hypothetical protein